MASKLKLTELLYPTSTTPAITLNSDNTVTFGASTTTITNLSATSITDSGNLTFTGTGNRITGDFSNATAANQVAFQTSTTNGGTTVSVIPNGTGVFSQLSLWANSDPANASRFGIRINSSSGIAILDSTITGTGTYFPITFYTGGSERLRLTTDGNLGLGVTPSAWGAGWAPIQFSGDVSVSRAGIGRNTYYDGSAYRYIGTAAATLMAQSSGVFQWFNAPSGTAGNAISFTQAMTLSAGGNLGIGVTSPGVPIDVLSNSSAVALKVRARAGDDFGFMQFTNNAGSTEWATVYAIPNTLVFGTAGGEKARILSNGNLLLGSTSSNAIGIVSLEVGGNNGDALITVRRNTTAAAGQVLFYNPNGSVGSIITTGSATSYNTASDHRLKENVAPMTGALQTVAALKPCTYNWKVDGSAGQGFIAHELQAVVPDAVTGEKDAVDADGKPQYQGVDTSFLVATLTAAIQELKAEFDAYKLSHP